MAPPRKDEWYAKRVAAAFLEQIKAGAGEWEKEWAPGARSPWPWNGRTGKNYTGANSLHFFLVAAAHGWTDPRWLTQRQAHQLGAKVKPEELARGTSGVFYKVKEAQARGAPESNEDAEDLGGEEGGGGDGRKRRWFIPRPFVVYNAAQIEGLPPLPGDRAIPAWQRNERVERLAASTKADIRYQDSSEAFYSPRGDFIVMPQRGQFPNPDAHARTLLHELAHWTGAESRLNRDMKSRAGLSERAREEMRAEISSMMLGEELQVGHGLKSHASYVAFWVRALKEDPQEIVAAARDATRISTYLLDMDPELKKEREAERDGYVAGANAHAESPETKAKAAELDAAEATRRARAKAERAHARKDEIWAGDASDGRAWPDAWGEVPQEGVQLPAALPAEGSVGRVIVVSGTLEAVAFHRLHKCPQDAAYVVDGPDVVAEVTRLGERVAPAAPLVLALENSPEGARRADELRQAGPEWGSAERLAPRRVGGWASQLLRAQRRERGREGASLGG